MRAPRLVLPHWAYLTPFDPIGGDGTANITANIFTKRYLALTWAIHSSVSARVSAPDIGPGPDLSRPLVLDLCSIDRQLRES